MRTRLRISVLLATLGVLSLAGGFAAFHAPSAEAKSCKWTTSIPDPSTPWIQVHVCVLNRP